MNGILIITSETWLLKTEKCSFNNRSWWEKKFFSMKTNMSSENSQVFFQFNTDYKKCFRKNCSSSNCSYGQKRTLLTTFLEAYRFPIKVRKWKNEFPEKVFSPQGVPLGSGQVECSFVNPAEKYVPEGREFLLQYCGKWWRSNFSHRNLLLKIIVWTNRFQFGQYYRKFWSELWQSRQKLIKKSQKTFA